MYSVEVLPSAAKALAKLDRVIQRRIARRIDSLTSDPRDGALKLRGAEDVWRICVGAYRVLYRIEDDRLLILVIRIGHRSDVYR